jgi:hypothetical protein
VIGGALLVVGLALIFVAAELLAPPRRPADAAVLDPEEDP